MTPQSTTSLAETLPADPAEPVEFGWVKCQAPRWKMILRRGFITRISSSAWAV